MSNVNPKSYEAAPATRCAFIGLGVMGYPMAAHLALAGHSVCVYNRTSAKAQAWVDELQAAGVPAERLSSAATPALAAQGGRHGVCLCGQRCRLARRDHRR